MTTPEKPVISRTQKERTDLARAKIIESAFYCFSHHGYQNTTMVSIAKHAGVSRETPRYHFGSKDDLVAELLARTRDTYLQNIAKAQTFAKQGVKAISIVVDASLTQLSADAELVRAHLILTFGAVDPGNTALRQHAINMQHQVQEAIKDLFLNCLQNDNIADASTHAEAIATLFHATLRGLSHLWITDPKALNVPQIQQELSIFFEQRLLALTETQ